MNIVVLDEPAVQQRLRYQDLIPAIADALAAARTSCDELGKLVGRWRQLVRVDLPAFNATLERHRMTTLAMPLARERLCSA